MNMIGIYCRRCMHCVGIRYVLLCAIATFSWAQGTQPADHAVENSIAKVRQGRFSVGDIDLVARSGAAKAIPDFKAQFAQTHDVVTKEAIASALVRLGDKEDSYWNFLVDHAKTAIESDMPFPTRFDLQGRIVENQLSPAFVSWTKAHNIPTAAAAETQFFSLPSNVNYLAATNDPRGKALLRTALLSPNYLIQAIAARALARLHDIDSVPLIIEACKKAPSAMAPGIASALVFFDDPQAQRALETYITNPKMLEMLRTLKREKGVAGLF
jgi:hypothetical protein